MACKTPRFDFAFDANSYKSPKSPYATVRVGQDGYIHSGECKSGDVFGLQMTNIHGRLNNTVMLNMSVENSYFGNIYAGNDVDRVITTRTHRDRFNEGADLKNVVFENVFYSCTDNEDSIAFDFCTNNRPHTMENVIIRNAFIGNARVGVRMEHQGRVSVRGLYSDRETPVIEVSEGGELIWE
jgi:hypothetical protein